MRKAALLVVVATALFGLGSPAHAALVTWTFSGTSSGSVYSGTPYTASVTYQSSTLPSSVGFFDSAIVSATFQTGSYAPVISVIPPNLNYIGIGFGTMQFVAGAPNGSESAESPRFQLVLGDLGALDQSHLPIAPPNPGFPAGAYFNLFVANGDFVYATVPISSIGYSVAEPGVSALVVAVALALVLRRAGSAATLG